jgi:hypothetical protein
MRADRSEGRLSSPSLQRQRYDTRSVVEKDSVHLSRSKLSASSSNLLNTAWAGRYVNLSRKIEVTVTASIILCSDKDIERDTLVF